MVPCPPTPYQFRSKGLQELYPTYPFLGIQYLKYAGTIALLPARLLRIRQYYVRDLATRACMSVPVLRVWGGNCAYVVLSTG